MTQLLGTLEITPDGVGRLRFERTLPHQVGHVWAAVTEPDWLAKWFPTTIEGMREAGATLRFAFADGLFEPFSGEMLAVDPEHMIEFSWGADVIRIELHAQEDGGGDDSTEEDRTVLVLVDVLEEVGKAARDAAGWHTCLDALEQALYRDPDARKQMNHWAELHALYVASFPQKASTIGPPEGMDTSRSADY